MSDACPTCGSLAVARCRCPLADMWCPNGHEWHHCPLCRAVQSGPSDHSLTLEAAACAACRAKLPKEKPVSDLPIPTPAEAAAAYNDSLAGAVAALLREHVLPALPKAAGGGAGVGFDAKFAAPAVWARAKELLAAKGWVLTLHGDQREGDYYTLEAKG